MAIGVWQLMPMMFMVRGSATHIERGIPKEAPPIQQFEFEALPRGGGGDGILGDTKAALRRRDADWRLLVPAGWRDDE
jgi:hypothetical protein